MTDEEKKALEIIKFLQDKCIQENGTGMMSIYRIDDLANAIETVLNLIEKQSKEIEELKEIYQTGYLNGCVSKSYEINKKWKGKIKAKIEEIDIEIQCCEYADDDTEEYKQYIEKEKRRLLRDKAVLQSLLEKE